MMRENNTHSYPLFHPRKMWVTLLTIWFCSFPVLAQANEIYVKDGDSFAMNGQDIRLWGIDAPEYNQTCENNGERYPCGLRAKEALQKMLSNAPALRCEPQKRARKETRIVARCFDGERDIAEMMVVQGWAIDYAYFSKGFYAGAQKSAKKHERGIWRGEFVDPYKFRKSN